MSTYVILIFCILLLLFAHTAVDCNTPLSITNGSPGTPTTTTFTGTVTYTCNDGYALFGIVTSTCQANATWSRSPECRGIHVRHLHCYASVGHASMVTHPSATPQSTRYIAKNIIMGAYPLLGVVYPIHYYSISKCVHWYYKCAFAVF